MACTYHIQRGEKNINMTNRKIFFILTAFLLCICFLLINFKKPLLNSNWDIDVTVLAATFVDEEYFTIKGARDWQYENKTIMSQEYFDQTYDFSDLQGATFYVQPLDYTGLIAHTFVVFHFDDSYGKYADLGISIETRRESGEKYSIIGGLFRKYELMHTWATEKDLTDRRIKFYDYELHQHNILIPLDQQVAILKQFLHQTNTLSTQPVFYNSAVNNCTSALAQYINGFAPGSIPWHYSFIFTGRADKYLQSLGYID